ncbi:DUF885 domain-containing protein [Lachnospiraceae bacterium 62-35]
MKSIYHDSTFYRRLYALLLITVLCLVGCIGKGQSKDPSSLGYEQYKASSGQEVEDTAASRQIQAEFDVFTDNLFREEVAKSTLTLHSLLADPAAAGITDAPISYGSVSLEALRADMEDTKQLLAQLDAFPEEQLTEDQQLTLSILKDYINTALLSDGLELYEQPLAPTIGIQAQLPVLLAEYVFYSKNDIDTYLALLAAIDEYFGQIGEFERAKAEAGLFISDTSIDNIITSCETYLINPEDNFITQTFDERLETVEGLTDEEKTAYRNEHIRILGEHFVPAYQNLIDTLSSLKGTGINQQGMCGYPEGKAYYEYLIHAVTATSFSSVDELKTAIERQMEQDTVAIGSILQAHPEVVPLVYNYSFRSNAPEEIIPDLQQQITKDFPALPECNYTIKDIPKALELSLSPAFYILPPLDRYEDNLIYINRNERFQDDPLYPTLAHEGYPGHLYQTVYFISKNHSRLRHLLSFGSYAEGWATYVEFQSYLFDNGLDENLQKILVHNRSTLLGLHAYLDLQINYYGWLKDDVASFLKRYFPTVTDDTVNEIFQTMIENPANYLEYYTGYLEISSMRQEAEAALGSQFSPKDFHTFILDVGPAPFTVLRDRFSQWLDKAKTAS